ncbi:ABC transporter permease [Chitinophaga horti]|uniref:ABC transporter permease n=1 Tax=Chitinophaga horti TaxID=2920382 RepID=A0ABY6J4C1_9BACT|nr:ABC transporter permease [Chitinophaga horti]UYQ94518.1 ABC transporter permease [Chitinophaga horti]
MIKSYFLSSFRFLRKNKLFTGINVFGLAIGTLCCLYILCYVTGHLRYDRHHAEADGIYRVTTSIKLPSSSRDMATASPPIAAAMKQDFGEVKQYTRVIPTLGVNQHLLRYQGNTYYEPQALLTDSTFFDVFSYHFVYGNPKTVFKEPYTMVLRKDVAEKLFGDKDPVGQLVELDNAWEKRPLKVTGVFDESLGASHLEAGMFICINGYSEDIGNNKTWSGNNYTHTYVKLHPQANAAALERKLPAFLERHGGEEMKRGGVSKVLHLQPLTEIHTTAGLAADTGKPVSRTFLYILVLIAVLIQVIACINFMNLSTARAAKRAREVGVRKVIGAGKFSLIAQFLGESFLLSLISVLIAIPLLIALLPYLNQLTQASINIHFLHDYTVWIALAGIVLVTGLAAGSYPAFYLSAFQAVKVLKGNFSNHISAAGVRRSLVVFQFVVSIIMITGIIVIYSQLQYISSKDLGFNKSQQLLFRFPTNEAKDQSEAFAQAVRELPEVKAQSRMTAIPGQFEYNNWGVYLSGGDVAHSIHQLNITADEHFISTFGIKLLSGANFHPGDSGKALINATLARQLGLNIADAPGTRLFTSIGETLEIAGVIQDFNLQSLRENVKPFMLLYARNPQRTGTLMVNVHSTDYPRLLGKMEGLWQQHMKGYPFVYAFMDEQLQRLYQSEETLSRIINAFALIAIFISCLGLFGLAAFNAEQRAKEISIRKVMGASVSGIIQLLSKDFLKLVLASFCLAAPVAWWAMDRWLNQFAYRVDISWWMFATAGLLALIITLATVSLQAMKAAVNSPLKSLRSE